MATYKRGTKEPIMNNLGTAMLAIPGIKFVEYQKVYDSDMKANKCPGCYINDVRIDKEKILEDVVKNTFQVGIVGFVYALSGQILSTILNIFMEQVKDAVIVDRTRGGNAYDTKIVLIETDAGSRYPQGMFVCMLEIIYFSSE